MKNIRQNNPVSDYHESQCIIEKLFILGLRGSGGSYHAPNVPSGEPEPASRGEPLQWKRDN